MATTKIPQVKAVARCVLMESPVGTANSTIAMRRNTAMMGLLIHMADSAQMVHIPLKQVSPHLMIAFPVSPGHTALQVALLEIVPLATSVNMGQTPPLPMSERALSPAQLAFTVTRESSPLKSAQLALSHSKLVPANNQNASLASLASTANMTSLSLLFVPLATTVL